MSDQDMIRLDEQLCFMLYAGSRAMTKAYQPMLKELKLTYPQYLVMMVLWEWAEKVPEEPTVKALGRRLHLDSGTLTPLLKRLEASDLVTRRRDHEDERRVFVAATEQGKSLELQASAWIADAKNSLESVGLDLPRLRQDLQVLMGLLSGEES
ncbi:MAG: MarR family winged helix-turn-helix transcriptional regulator [Cellvibrionaceae bacterium]